MDKEARAWCEQVKETINSVSICMKTVFSNSLNEHIRKRIETNKGNNFCNSGRNKSEEEKASKGKDSQEINKNSWSSRSKKESGEYVLNRP